ncbi:MAG TPA: hypothetical protein VFW21_01790 [Mycobacterium sp.]|nr:hypothetical protein [Mycobacterium sp.]
MPADTPPTALVNRFEEMYRPDPLDHASIADGSLWWEQHRRALEINRMLRRRWPNAAPTAQLLLGDDFVLDVVAAVPSCLTEPGVIELSDGVDEAFRRILGRRAADAPTDPTCDVRLVVELERFDDAIAGRRPAIDAPAEAALEFTFDVMSHISVISHYATSHAPAALLRAVPPIVRPTRLVFAERKGVRTARRAEG